MSIEFAVAEVIEHDSTYRYIDPELTNTNSQNLFPLKLQIVGDFFNVDPIIARPSNNNIKKIPLVGEFVLVYKTFNQQSNGMTRRDQWYYLDVVNIQSAINENLLPGIARGTSQQEIDGTIPGKTFKRKAISPLQPYEGDLLLEGRWGNSIRFGSTVEFNKGQYTLAGDWRGTKSGDPITIISNGRVNKPQRQFVTDNIEDSDSTIYLTSRQQLPNFTLNHEIKGQYKESEFSGSQILGSADRITLKSKSDIIVLDSKVGIHIQSPSTKLGTGNHEPMLQTNEVISALRTIVTTITNLQDSAGGLCVPLDATKLTSIDWEKMKSTEVFISQWKG
jgi:hypothetical protein